VIVGVALWMANTRARSGPNPEPPRRRIPAPNAGKPDASVRPPGRPSLRA